MPRAILGKVEEVPVQQRASRPIHRLVNPIVRAVLPDLLYEGRDLCKRIFLDDDRLSYCG
ncbi:hypothetical protein D3C73_1542050 [compost metagenome]